MSWRLSADALDYSPYDGRTLLVLISLASWADDDGSHIYPRVETLATKARCSVRQAQRALRQMESDGVLIVVKKGGGRSLTEYRIDVEKLRDGQGCQNGTGDTSDAKPARNVTSEVTKRAAHIDNRSTTRSVTLSAPAGAGESDAAIALGKGEPERFREFRDSWAKTMPNAFPAKDEAQAEAEFTKITRLVPAVELIGALRLHGEAETQRAARYTRGDFRTKLPSTWLRERGWKGYLQQVRDQAALAVGNNDALARVREALGTDVFGRLVRCGVTDAELARFDGLIFQAPATFVADRPFQAARLRHHRPQLEREFGKAVQVQERRSG